MSREDPYRNPALYDLEYADQTEDIAWYLDLARRIGGPVLELACGNGRILLPTARAGVEVHGLDVSQAMLDDLARKLAGEPEDVCLRVRYGLGDYRRLEALRRHPLVTLPFNALHHCRDGGDVLALLSGVRRALLPGGRFALDCYLPDRSLYDRDPDERHEERAWIDPRGGRVRSWEQSWWEEEARTHHVVYVYQRDDDPPERVHLALRMFELPELHRLFARGGFRVVREASDFAGSRLAPRSLKWVGILEPA